MAAASHRHYLILATFLSFLFPNIITGEFYSNGSEILLNPQQFTEFRSEFRTQFESVRDNEDGKNRTKRNNLNNAQSGFGGGSGAGSVEGLLASCQLTNILLYQLLQQSNSNGQFLSPATGVGGNFGNVAQPFPAAAGLVNNFLFPARLTTFVTTSTFTTKMTSSTIITIPLLFGNKPSPTTITRTTTYDITTSEVQTITTTIKPSSTTTAVVGPTPTRVLSAPTPLPYVPTPSFQEFDPEYNDNNDSNDILDFQNSAPHPQISDEEVVPIVARPKGSFRTRKKIVVSPAVPSQPMSRVLLTRKVLRANPATTQNIIEESDSERTPAYRYGPEAYGVKKWEPTARRSYFREPEVQPTREDYRQDQDEEVLSRNYYARRLKRRGEADGAEEADQQPEEVNLDRQFLLEPSFRSDAFSSPGFREEVKCTPLTPQEITVTVTKTITKFINPPVGVASAAPKEFARPTSSGYGQDAKTGDQWQPTDQGRRRGGRRFEVSRAEVEQTPSPSSSAYHELAREPTPTPSRTRARTKTPQQAQEGQQQRLGYNQEVAPLDNSQATPFQEPVRTRSRGRGDILNRVRGSPATTIPEVMASENYSGEVGDTGRVHQRKRIRRPSE